MTKSDALFCFNSCKKVGYKLFLIIFFAFPTLLKKYMNNISFCNCVGSKVIENVADDADDIEERNDKITLNLIINEYDKSKQS